MTRHLHLLAATALLCAAGCGVGGANAAYVARDERRFTVSGKPTIALSTFDGSIQLRSWDRPEVLVVIERHAADAEAAAAIEVRTSQDANRVTVDVGRGSGGGFLGFGQSASASLIVTVPATADVTVRTEDGSIDAAELSGLIDLESGDGAVRGSRLSGELRIHSGDGSIELDAVAGDVSATTGDGSVAVSGRLTGLQVTSGDGAVRVQAEGGSVPQDDWSIETGDGSVVLALPDGFAGELDAITSDGTASLDGFTLATVTSRSASVVQGRLGAGGRPIRIRTADGSIVVRRS